MPAEILKASHGEAEKKKDIKTAFNFTRDLFSRFFLLMLFYIVDAYFCFIQNPQSYGELDFIFIPNHVKTLQYKEEKENYEAGLWGLLAHQGTGITIRFDSNGGKYSTGSGML